MLHNSHLYFSKLIKQFMSKIMVDARYLLEQSTWKILVLKIEYYLYKQNKLLRTKVDSWDEDENHFVNNLWWISNHVLVSADKCHSCRKETIKNKTLECMYMDTRKVDSCRDFSSQINYIRIKRVHMYVNFHNFI